MAKSLKLNILNFYIGLILTFLLFPVGGTALETGKKPLDRDQPIEITSDRMRSEGGGEKIVFSGSVVGIWGKLTITSDILEVYNSPEKDAGNEIIAIGNVVIVRDNKKARGDKARYLDKQQKIILTGSPKATAWEDKNIIEGQEMIFLLEEDRIVVNKRVRVQVFLNEQENDSAKKKAWIDAKK
jgi:lipopolysaccharide export system protein LptA